jgi:hypothetical protein
MANIPIWNNNPGPVWGNTPYGFYDNDQNFQQEAPLFATWGARRLGYPIVNVELQDINFYACLEEAITAYGNEVYQYKIREGYLSMEGNIVDNTTTFNNQLVTPNLGTVIRIAETYGSEGGAGGYTTYYTGSIKLQNGVQDYDLKAWASASGIFGSGIEIKKIFYEQPAIVRYFDPYAGTGTGIQSLLETFGFGQFSPGINFLLMPIYFDVQKLQSIELNDQIRKSAYSFDLVNNNLRLFPIPQNLSEGLNDKLLFHYIKRDERNDVTSATPDYNPNTSTLVTNVSNVPYANPVYCEINSVGRQWIRQYALAVVKETLGYVRKKYASIPIPGAEVTLNGDDLLTDARAEKAALLEQLRAMLDVTSRKTQLENQAMEADFIQKTLINAPIGIYIF